MPAEPSQPSQEFPEDPTLVNQAGVPVLIPPSAGTILADTYRLEKQLGAGGMGEVWLATHLLLQQPRAIKLMLDNSNNSALRDRFIQGEARNALRLLHPNIVRVYDLGQYQGMPYIVMEYVEGYDLKKFIQNTGKLSLNQAEKIVTGVGQALEVAHREGLVHRDLKPANIMISNTGAVKLSDFGIVKDMKNSLEFTGQGLGIGTPYYMSPEQAKGEAEPRSDIYSLGIVLYEMLTGQPPFKGDMVSVFMQHAGNAPTAPHLIDASITPVVSEVVLKALAKRPQERYSSSMELVVAYQAAIAQSDSTLFNSIKDDGLLTVPLVVVPNTLQPLTKEPPHNLPELLNPLLGREHEIAEISVLLRLGKTRLLTLTGIGGTGKTSLSLVVARKMLREFEDGVFFVELENVTSQELLVSALAHTLEVPESPEQTLLQSLKEYLKEKHLLLVLDNFEQLIRAAPLMAELIKVAPKLFVLTTSRIALRLSLEKEYSIEPLALPDLASSQFNTRALTEFPAVQLFVERAKSARPGFVMGGEQAQIVAEICVKLDGLPLAIELAAARIRALTPQMILTRLNQRLKLLINGSKDLPARQQTLRGAIDWSYNLLGEGEQQLFTRLAVFTGGCRLDTAEQICNSTGDLAVDTLDGVETLLNYHLLRQHEEGGGEMRYTMLQTLREYALEKLQERGEVERMEQNFVEWFLKQCQETNPQLEKAQHEQAIKWFDLEYTNLRAAFELSLEKKQKEMAFELGAALWMYWTMKGLWSEGRSFLDKAQALPGEVSAGLAAKLLNGAGGLAFYQGNLETAREYFEQSLGLKRQINDTKGIATALNNLAGIVLEQGDIVAAQAYLLQSYGVLQELNDPAGMATILTNLGVMLVDQEDFEQARKYYLQALEITENNNNKWGLEFLLSNLGMLDLKEQNFEQARQYFQHSLLLAQELGDKSGITESLYGLGQVEYFSNQPIPAIALFTQSLKGSQELGDGRGSIRNLVGIVASCTIEVPSKDTAIQFHLAGKLAGIIAEMLSNKNLRLDALEKQTFDRSQEKLNEVLGEGPYLAALKEGKNLDIEKAISLLESRQDLAGY